jgi:glycosyltransferase involved in cell wall biosynthesis
VLVSPQVGAGEVLTGALAEGIVDCCDDADKLGERIARLMQGERRRALSEEARRLAERYSWDNHFRSLERVLFEVAGREP